jgi:long-chain acyl-CoA synthetase
MAVQRAVAERWKQAMGVPIVEGYGLTETSPVVTCNPVNIKDWTGTIGLPIPSTEVAILDDAGRELALGQEGEICTRGPQVTKGYWKRPDETAKVFTEDGWFRTGDMGFINEKGYVKLTDRKKDVILVSGFNVYPNEVEDVVMMHPGVLEVAAVSVPSDKSGEAVKVVVVKKDSNLTAEEVIQHCKKHLTGYKVPKIVEFSTEPLPKTTVGKVLRRLLRDQTSARKAA